jgi:transcriptional regulator with XRE-family HTH domain
MARLDQESLAELAGVAVNTVRRIEAVDGPASANLATVRKLQRALEATGVEFRPDGSVRLREAAETP